MQYTDSLGLEPFITSLRLISVLCRKPVIEAVLGPGANQLFSIFIHSNTSSGQNLNALKNSSP